jgi:hypothetical protein
MQCTQYLRFVRNQLAKLKKIFQIFSLELMGYENLRVIGFDERRWMELAEDVSVSRFWHRAGFCNGSASDFSS